MSHANSKEKYSANVNTVLLESFASILEKLEQEASIPGQQPDITPLNTFLDHHYNIVQLIQSWSYYANINDHSSLTALTTKLTKVIRFSNKILALHASTLELINEIISGPNFKVLYRSLNNSKPNLTNSALRLMSEIVIFANGSVVDKFLDGFDLNLKILPQLAVPTKLELAEPAKYMGKDTIRSTFIEFWLDLCANSNPMTRKELLINNKKIMSNVLKYINTHDSTKILNKLLKFFDEKVLTEISFKKMTKCKIFSEFMLKKLCELYSISSIRQETHQLLLKLSTDYKVGIVFEEEKVWFNVEIIDSEFSSAGSYDQSSGSSGGVSVVVGERSFKIHNKLIYFIISNLRPWADDLQLNLVVEILQEVPELLPIYNYYLSFSNGYHDPKLSSFWIGQSLLLTRITNSPIPKKFSDLLKMEVRKLHQSTSSSNNELALTGSKILSASVLADAIFPTQLSRSALTKGLSSDSQLIKHTTSQLIIACLNKVQSTLELLSYDGSVLFSTVKTEFLELVLKIRLPEIRSISEAISDTVKGDNKYLLLNLLKVTEKYAIVLGHSLPVALPNEVLKMNATDAEFKGIDLLILDSYLQIQKDSEADSYQQKWWNVSKGTKNSLFTTITRLPYDISKNSGEPLESSIVRKVIEILSSLVDSSIIFTNYKSPSTKILDSQLYALVDAFEKFQHIVIVENMEQEVDYLCSTLDETVSRCATTPYKYLDIVQETCTNKSSLISPFFVTLVEQSKFYKGTSSNIIKWINLFARNLAIMGESSESLNEIITKYYPDKLEVGFTAAAVSEVDYENSLSEYRKAFNIDQSQSVFETVMNSSIKSLERVLESLIPTSDHDIVGVLRRCDYLIESSNINLQSCESVLVGLILKYGNYVFQKSDMATSTLSISNLALLSSKYWSNLFISGDRLKGTSESILSKRLFVSSLLNEIFSNFNSSKTSDKDSSYESCMADFRKHVVELLEYFSTAKEINNAAEKITSDALWVLDDSSIIKFLNIKGCALLRFTLLKLAVSREISIDEAKFKVLMTTEMNKESSELLGKLALRVKFSDLFITDLFEKCLSDKENGYFLYSTVESIISQDASFTEILIARITEIPVDFFSTRKQDLTFYVHLWVHHKDLPLFKAVSEKSVLKINEAISQDAIQDIPLLEYLSCLSHFSFVSNEEKLTMIERLIQLDSFNNNASLVFSQEFASFVSSLENIKEPTTFSVLRPWLYRGALYTTKMFAETEEEHLPADFLRFIISLKEIFFLVNVWHVIPKSVLNSQLEVILSKEKWICLEEAIDYMIFLVLNAQPKDVDYSRAFQLLLNNEKNSLYQMDNKDNAEIKTKTAILAYTIFQFDKSALSTPDIQLKIAGWYSGSIRSHDVILKGIMVDLESELEKSWVSYVSNWDYQDSNETLAVSDFKLFSKMFGSTGFVVTLSNLFVNNTINNPDCSFEDHNIANVDKLSARSKWDTWCKFMKHAAVSLSSTIPNGDFKNTVYDTEFLLLVIINNEELFSQGEEEFRVDVKKLVETNLLQFIVVSLANKNQNVKNIAKQILSSCFANLMQQIEQVNKLKESDSKVKTEDSVLTPLQKVALGFKEREVFRVYLGNLLATLENESKATNGVEGEGDGENTLDKIPPVNVIMLSHLIPILNNPSHHLYERTYRYILGGPSFRPLDIPLYKSITQSFIVDPHSGRAAQSSSNWSHDDNYYKSISWLLNKLEISLGNFADLKPINRSGFLEWLLSLTSSPFVNAGLLHQIMLVLFKIQDIPNGADLLIRNYGMLAFTELKKFKIKYETEKRMGNQVGAAAKITRDSVLFDFSLLNYQKLIVRGEVAASASGADKRAREWTSGDLGPAVKRVLLP